MSDDRTGMAIQNITVPVLSLRRSKSMPVWSSPTISLPVLSVRSNRSLLWETKSLFPCAHARHGDQIKSPLSLRITWSPRCACARGKKRHFFSKDQEIPTAFSLCFSKVAPVAIYLCTRFRQNTLAKYTSGYRVGTYIISDQVECQSRDEKNRIITKDVVGLLLGEVVGTKKTLSKRMWLAYF